MATIAPNPRVDVLLKEYEMAQDNRNHYENGRWLIGTIFIAASLTLFGVSFLKDITRDVTGLPIIVLALLSSVLLLIWKAYWNLVQPYVDESFQRLWEIECQIRHITGTKRVQGVFPRLHTNIAEETERSCRRRRGRRITDWMLGTLLFAWFLRVLLVWPSTRPAVMFLLGTLLGSSVMLFVCLVRPFHDP